MFGDVAVALIRRLQGLDVILQSLINWLSLEHADLSLVLVLLLEAGSWSTPQLATSQRRERRRNEFCRREAHGQSFKLTGALVKIEKRVHEIKLRTYTGVVVEPATLLKMDQLAKNDANQPRYRGKFYPRFNMDGKCLDNLTSGGVINLPTMLRVKYMSTAPEGGWIRTSWIRSSAGHSLPCTAGCRLRRLKR